MGTNFNDRNLPANSACDDCVVCLEPLLVSTQATARLVCGHLFHLCCIGSTFNASSKALCPVCRQDQQQKPGPWLRSGDFQHCQQSAQPPEQEGGTLGQIFAPIIRILDSLASTASEDGQLRPDTGYGEDDNDERFGGRRLIMMHETTPAMRGEMLFGRYRSARPATTTTTTTQRTTTPSLPTYEEVLSEEVISEREQQVQLVVEEEESMELSVELEQEDSDFIVGDLGDVESEGEFLYCSRVNSPSLHSDYARFNVDLYEENDGILEQAEFKRFEFDSDLMQGEIELMSDLMSDDEEWFTPPTLQPNSSLLSSESYFSCREGFSSPAIYRSPPPFLPLNYSFSSSSSTNSIDSVGVSSSGSSGSTTRTTSPIPQGASVSFSGGNGRNGGEEQRRMANPEVFAGDSVRYFTYATYQGPGPGAATEEEGGD